MRSVSAMRAWGVLLLLALSSPAFAWGPCVQMIGFGETAGAVCDNTTDFIGSKGTGASGGTSTDRIYMQRYQAMAPSGCTTGTLSVVAVRNGGTVAGSPKVCLWTSSAATPADGDALVACATVTSDNTLGWKYADAPDTAVTPGNYYWVGVIPDGSFAAEYSTASGSTYYKSSAGWYNSPPSTLTASGWTNLTRTYSAYMSIK